MSREPSTKPERRRVRYTGRVQGVGFRASTRRVSDTFRVTGYVKNLVDGSVEVVVEGHPVQLDRFLAAVAVDLGRYIVDIECERLPATGEFARFVVAY